MLVLLFAILRYLCSLFLIEDPFELLEEADITLKLDERYLGGLGCKKAFGCSFSLDVSFKFIDV